MEAVLAVLIMMVLFILVGWLIDFKDVLQRICDKVLCRHLWYVEDKLETKTYKDGEKENRDYPIKIEQFLICKHCGKIRKVMAK